jgi:hypothetical protein
MLYWYSSSIGLSTSPRSKVGDLGLCISVDEYSSNSHSFGKARLETEAFSK